MQPLWHRRLDAARDRVLADAKEIMAFLDSPNADVRRAAKDVLAAVCWKPKDFYVHYFDLLMRENLGG